MDSITKKCSKCEKEKPLVQFVRDARRASGRGAHCISCNRILSASWHSKNREASREKSREWRLANPEKAREKSRRYAARHPEAVHSAWLKTKYGITLDDYNALSEKQDGVCAICGERESTLHVDHNHITGVVRGLLCGNCNRALGMMKDNPMVFTSAARYLETKERKT